MGKLKLVEIQAQKLIDILGKDGYQVLKTSDETYHINLEDKDTEKMDYNLRYNLIDQEIMPIKYQEQYLNASFSEMKKQGRDYPALHSVMSSGVLCFNLLSRLSKTNLLKYKNAIGREADFELELPSLATIGTVKFDAYVPTNDGMMFFDVKYLETFKKKDYVLLDRYFEREEHLDTNRENFSLWDTFFTDMLGPNCKNKSRREKEEGYLDLVRIVKHLLAINHYVKSNHLTDIKIYYVNVAFEVPELNNFDEYEEYRSAQVEARGQVEQFKPIIEDFMRRLDVDFEFVYLSTDELVQKYLTDEQTKKYYQQRYYIGK